MRQLLHRAFGGPLEVVLRRLEQSVTIDAHLELARRLAGRRRSASGDEPSGSVPALERLLIDHATFEAATALECDTARTALTPADVSTLRANVDRLAGSPVAGLVDLSGAAGAAPTASLEVAARDSAWDEDPAAREAMRSAATAVLASLRLGSTTTSDAEVLLANLTNTPKPRVWFLKRGVVYGTGELLRSLLALLARKPDAALTDYTRDVCDRLIRHLEVRREDYLPFRPDSRPEGACDELEKLRFTLALLDASRLFGDSRYLNAAMKANDWHYRWLMKATEKLSPSAGTPTDDLELAATFYLMSLAQQEELVRELAG